jgi:hypothetical protein
MKDFPMKKPVSVYVLHNVLSGLLGLTDEQVQYLMTIDNHDPVVLRTLIRRWVTPVFVEYDEDSQARMKDSLGYFLARNDNTLERVLLSCQVQIEPPSGREFFLLIWSELFLFEFAAHLINLDDYQEVEGTALANSLRKIGFSG